MGKYADMILGPSEAEPQTSGKWSTMLLGEPATGGFTGQQMPGPNDPQTPPGLSSKDIVRDTDAGASLSTAAVASFADDPKVQIGYYASKRFPDLPPEEAIKRYQVVDGTIAYQGDDGRYYAETPGVMRSIAGGASKAIPIAAGGATAVATAPMWLTPGGAALSTELTALASGAGESVRQGIGSELLGDPASMAEVGKEMAFSVGGDVAGGLITKGLARGAARDITRIDPADVQLLQNLSRKYGIDLTPAELTNLPSLKAQQTNLGNRTVSADTMGDFYVRRAGQVDEAVSKELSNISQVDSAEQAGLMGRSAAESSIKGARKARSEAARPLYEFVNDPNTVVPDQIFASIKGDTFLAKEIQRVKKDDLAGMGGYADNSLPVLDQVKKNLDDDIAEFIKSGKTNRVRLLETKRRKLLEATDNAFPDYPLARAAFAGDSPAVDELEKGVVGVISKLKDTRAKDAAQALFNPTRSGPKQAAIAKEAIKKTDPEAWQALKRAYLEDIWQKSSKESVSTQGLNRGAKFRAVLFGDKKQETMLKIMLEPDEYKSLSDLSRVLEASGRVKPVGSDTAYKLEMDAIEKDASRPLLAKIARKLKFTSFPSMVDEWATGKAVQESRAQLAHIITSPDGISTLKELRRLPPSSARAAVLSAYLLGIGGRVAAASTGGESDSQGQQ